MSLSENLSNLIASRGNWGCVTCLWLEGLSKEDRGAFDDWVTKKLSLVQLWDACALETSPLKVSISGLRNHIRHHQLL